MFLRLLLVSLVLAAVLGGIFGWKNHVAQLDAAAQSGPPPAVVAATRASVETWQPSLQVVGSLAAVAGIEVSSEVAGQVETLHFEAGQQVARGTLLLQLDDQTDRAQLQGLLAARNLARLRYARTAKLIEDKSVSKSELDEARAALDSAEAQVATQQALLDKKRIRAPFDGRLGIGRVDPGAYLSPGAPIVPLEALDPIFADFNLPERELARVGVGQLIEVRVQAHPQRVFQGSILAMDPGVEIGSRSFRLRAQLPNPDELLRPGMFADVKVLLPERHTVLTIPDTAISYAPYGDSVFVIVSDGDSLSVQRREITVGQSRDGRIEVQSGLSAGDLLVGAGHNKLRNAQAVVIDPKAVPGEREPQS